LFFGERLPLLSYFLHNLQSSHFRVSINNRGSCLKMLKIRLYFTSLTKIMYAERHFLGFFNFSEYDSKDLSSFSYLSLSI
jgi:hypothetical protein